MLLQMEFQSGITYGRPFYLHCVKCCNIRRTLNCTRSSCGAAGLPFWTPPPVRIMRLVAFFFRNFPVLWIVFLTVAATSMSILKSFVLQLSLFQVSLSISSTALIKFLSSFAQGLSSKINQSLITQSSEPSKIEHFHTVNSCILAIREWLVYCVTVFPPKFLIRCIRLSFFVSSKAQIHTRIFNLPWLCSQLIEVSSPVSLHQEM